MSSWNILSPTRMRWVWDDFEPSIDKDKRDFFLVTLGTHPTVGGSARIIRC